jgi:hypothetical protein
MLTRTGSYLAAQRRLRHLNSQELAAAIGYTNVVKGARRILALERDGVTAPGLLDKIISVLALDPEHVHALVADDLREFQDAWDRWADEPIEPELRRRLIPAVWGRVQMPKGLSRAEAVEFAKTRAVAEGFTFVLIWSRREEIWCYPSGRTLERVMNVGDVAGPFSKLRGRGERRFVLG